MGALALPLAATAQSFCASDGQPAPSTIAERFISADCDACWGNAGKKLAHGALALDWIVPGSLGEDAPLSAAAQRDGLARLEALHRQPPGGSATALVQTRVHRGITGRIRVAHGLPLADYIGASIELKPVPRAAGPRPWTAWLLLVETIAAGSEGTSIERNLVRNALVQEWTPSQAAPAAEPPAKGKPVPRLFESRPMGIPAGAKPERLRVVGWVQDAQGRVFGAAQSRCVPSE
jgi:hypothetical protein